MRPGRFIESKAQAAGKAKRIAEELVSEGRLSGPSFAHAWARWRLELSDRPPHMGATAALRAQREHIGYMVDQKLGLEGPAKTPGAVSREQAEAAAEAARR